MKETILYISKSEQDIQSFLKYLQSKLKAEQKECTLDEKHDVLKDKRLTVVKTKTKDYYKYISSSKYWIVNSIMDESISKKKNQIYLQCWHGTPLKRLRYDIEVNGAVLNTIKGKKYKFFVCILTKPCFLLYL